jgi:catechol 2,3-dioxygenase-like lactoylglutathione lyase family enzyme
MRVEALDHVNLRTPDVTGTARFFADVLGLSITPSPGNDDPEKALWICDGEGRAIVHLARPDIAYPWEPEGGAAPALPGTGRLHHVALRCTGYAALCARLSEMDIFAHANEIPQVSLRQLFVTDPNGVMLELNFFGD